MSYQTEKIERTIAALRSALLDGIVPGGGTALLRCVTGLRERYERVAPTCTSAPLCKS